jgi:hypothetical protein
VDQRLHELTAESGNVRTGALLLLAEVLHDIYMELHKMNAREEE